MTAHLSPVEKPQGLMNRMGYWYTKRAFGRVPEPLSVFCARMPSAFTSYYGKVSKLDKKLSLAPELAMLVREQVATVNGCAFCMDSNRWAAMHRGKVPAAKLDALSAYECSDVFDARERAALHFATEVASQKRCSADTFAQLHRQFGEREICELTWLVASEHLYNINNVALNIGSAGMCEVPPAEMPPALAGR